MICLPILRKKRKRRKYSKCLSENDVDRVLRRNRERNRKERERTYPISIKSRIKTIEIPSKTDFGGSMLSMESSDRDVETRRRFYRSQRDLFPLRLVAMLRHQEKMQIDRSKIASNVWLKPKFSNVEAELKQLAASSVRGTILRKTSSRQFLAAAPIMFKARQFSASKKNEILQQVKDKSTKKKTKTTTTTNQMKTKQMLFTKKYEILEPVFTEIMKELDLYDKSQIVDTFSTVNELIQTCLLDQGWVTCSSGKKCMGIGFEMSGIFTGWFKRSRQRSECEHDGCDAHFLYCPDCRYERSRASRCKICMDENLTFCDFCRHDHEEDCRKKHEKMCGFSKVGFRKGHCRNPLEHQGKKCSRCKRRGTCSNCFVVCPGVRRKHAAYSVPPDQDLTYPEHVDSCDRVWCPECFENVLTTCCTSSGCSGLLCALNQQRRAQFCFHVSDVILRSVSIARLAAEDAMCAYINAAVRIGNAAAVEDAESFDDDDDDDDDDDGTRTGCSDEEESSYYAYDT